MESLMQKNATELVAGRLEGMGVHELIWSLGRDRRTGVLSIRRFPIQKKLYIEDGRVIFATSSDPNNRLGETLLRQGKVTISQLERALGQLGTGRRIGTLMVESGILTPQQLHVAVTDQIRGIVIDLLNWEGGEYSFIEGSLPSIESITLQTGREELLMEGIRQIRSVTRIRLGAGSPRTICALLADWRKRSESMGLNDAEKLVVEHLTHGDQSIQQLCSEVCLSSFEIHRALWAFNLLGLVETRSPRPEAVDRDYEGQLSEISFPELFTRVSLIGTCGVLYVYRGGIERSFHFDDGRCTFATSGDPDDGLVPFLFRRGMISLNDREETARRLLSNKRVGTILREMGVIDDEDLHEMVRQQVAQIIYDTFCWDDGDYVFIPGSLPSAEETTLDLNVAAVVAEGIRRIGSWTRVIQGCGGMDNPLCLTPHYLDVLDSMNAGVGEWEVVNNIKHPQTPRRVCRLCEIDDFRTCQILWTLRLLGGLEDSPVEVDESILEGLPTPEFEAPDQTFMVADEALAPAGTEPEASAADHEEPAGHSEAPQTERAETEQARVSADEIPQEAPIVAVEADTAAAPVAASAWAVAGASLEDDTTAQRVLIKAELSELAEKAGKAAGGSEMHDEADESEATEEPAAPVPLSLDETPQEVSEPDWPLPEGVDRVISRFNAMHRVVFRAIKAEVGAGAANFVRSCCIKLPRDMTDPVEGVDLNWDGAWDVDGLKRAIGLKRIEDPWPAYQGVLDAEFVSLEPHLGSRRSDTLKRKILEIERSN